MLHYFSRAGIHGHVEESSQAFKSGTEAQCMKLISVRCAPPLALLLSSVFALHLNHPPRMSYCSANTPREKRCISGKVCVVLGARRASRNPWKHVGRILPTQNRCCHCTTILPPSGPSSVENGNRMSARRRQLATAVIDHTTPTLSAWFSPHG